MASNHGPSIKDELYDRAKELDTDGRSTMNKSELISALRD